MRRLMWLAGFTLIEMIVVIVVSGILAAVVWRNISQPIEGFEEVTRRAELVNIAETALHRMTSEIRLALPNSIRLKTTGTQTGLEFLRTLTGGRYRAVADATNNDFCPGLDGDTLNFNVASDCFEVLGGLPNFGAITAGANQNDCLTGPADCLVIFNTGVAGADAYAGDNIAVVTGTTTSTVSFNIAPGKTKFPFQSPTQRFYIVDTPVSFVCDTATSSPINRFDTYAITAIQSVTPGGSSNRLADRATCNITYDAGTSTRAGLVTISITVAEASITSGGNMQVTILDQVHVLNVP